MDEKTAKKAFKKILESLRVINEEIKNEKLGKLIISIDHLVGENPACPHGTFADNCLYCSDRRICIHNYLYKNCFVCKVKD
jgi:hypothetical protein